MKRLRVKNFSCISQAVLDVKDITLIIGPQASGKSVLCKLFYFFHSVPGMLSNWVTDDDANSFEDRVLGRFSEWFPPTTWGNHAFAITYESGKFSLTISRHRGKSVKARLAASEAFQALIDKVGEIRAGHLKKVRDVTKSNFDSTWRIYEVLGKTISNMMGADHPGGQLYIPAGRSFFTSIGKIVTAFESGGMLDPVVSNFGRLITSLREHQIFPDHQDNPILAVISDLIGGSVTKVSGKEFLSTPDGRKIPFSALSSGQQELLPLFEGLRFATNYGDNRLVYIEEPEAHLFPSAQTQLVSMFVRLVNQEPKPRPTSGRQKPATGMQLVLTTHSPYVLAKMNNLIKAGSMAEQLSLSARKRLAKIVPEDTWLPPSRVAAYCIDHGCLKPIIDESGLIDGNYIDSVSEITGSEFDDMLEIEVSE